jgi:hypothetical protein
MKNLVRCRFRQETVYAEARRGPPFAVRQLCGGLHPHRGGAPAPPGGAAAPIAPGKIVGIGLNYRDIRRT